MQLIGDFYQHLDGLLREIHEAAGKETHLFMVSDHRIRAAGGILSREHLALGAGLAELRAAAVVGPPPPAVAEIAGEAIGPLRLAEEIPAPGAPPDRFSLHDRMGADQGLCRPIRGARHTHQPPRPGAGRHCGGGP